MSKNDVISNLVDKSLHRLLSESSQSFRIEISSSHSPFESRDLPIPDVNNPNEAEEPNYYDKKLLKWLKQNHYWIDYAKSVQNMFFEELGSEFQTILPSSSKSISITQLNSLCDRVKELHQISSPITQHPLLHIYLASQFINWKQFSTALHYLLQAALLLQTHPSSTSYKYIIYYSLSLIYFIQHKFSLATENLEQLIHLSQELDSTMLYKIIPLYYTIQIDVLKDIHSAWKVWMNSFFKRYSLKQSLFLIPLWSSKQRFVKSSLHVFQWSSIIAILIWLLKWLFRNTVTLQSKLNTDLKTPFSKQSIDVQVDPFQIQDAFNKDDSWDLYKKQHQSHHQRQSKSSISWNQFEKWKQDYSSLAKQHRNKISTSLAQNLQQQENMDKQIQEQVMKKGYYGQMVQLSAHSSSIFDYFAAAREFNANHPK